MTTAIILLVIGAVVVAVLLLRRGARVEPIAEPSAEGLPAADPQQFLSLLASYRLEHHKTGFFGDWKQTNVDGVRVAFLGGGFRMGIIAGDFDPDEEQLTDIYLSKVSEKQPLPERESQRIDAFVDEHGTELAERFFLNAGPAPDYPELRDDQIRAGLLTLSDSVTEVSIYESVGVELFVDLGTTNRTRVENDVRQAVSMVRALRESRAAVA